MVLFCLFFTPKSTFLSIICLTLRQSETASKVHFIPLFFQSIQLIHRPAFGAARVFFSYLFHLLSGHSMCLVPKIAADITYGRCIIIIIVAIKRRHGVGVYLTINR